MIMKLSIFNFQIMDQANKTTIEVENEEQSPMVVSSKQTEENLDQTR